MYIAMRFGRQTSMRFNQRDRVDCEDPEPSSHGINSKLVSSVHVDDEDDDSNVTDHGR